MKYPISFLVALTFLIGICQEGLSQDSVSILSLASLNGECPTDVRNYIRKLRDIKYLNTRAWEARMIIQDSFAVKDSIILVKSYSVKTILDAKGRVPGIKVPYIKGTRNFSPVAYKRITEYINRSDKYGGMEIESWDYIELSKVPETLLKKLLSKICQNETPHMDLGADGTPQSTYSIGNVCKIQVEKHQLKYSIRIWNEP